MLSLPRQILSGRNRRRGGFTIVELLIVIVIIGILAAIVIVAYNGITNRANASSLADGFRAIEKAMRLTATSDNMTAWPAESGMGTGGNPSYTASNIMAGPTSFKNYMSVAPSTSGYGTGWRYDNDGDTYGGCSASGAGINIFIDNFTDADMAQKVDAIIDDGNTSCGKLRWVSSVYLMYSLSNDGSL